MTPPRGILVEAAGEPMFWLVACSGPWTVTSWKRRLPVHQGKRVYKACCNSQRLIPKSRQARLPIQHELTLALAGRVSRLPRRKKDRRRRMMLGNEQGRNMTEKRR